MLTWQENARPTYQPTEVLEESRQHYATVRIQEFQRAWAPAGRTPSFSEVLRAFREYGLQYDCGNRIQKSDVQHPASS